MKNLELMKKAIKDNKTTLVYLGKERVGMSIYALQISNYINEVL